jgi:hypothetical protein
MSVLWSGRRHGGDRPLVIGLLARSRQSHSPDATDVATAALTGSPMYEGGCLLFRDEGNRVQLMPVWPDGSSFNGTSVTFHEPGKTEQRIIVGEEFLMEGQPIQWARMPGPRAPLYRQKCNRETFAVLGVHPAN